MADIDDRPAYPCINPDSAMVKDDFKGLTKREYFSAMALSGVLADRRAMCRPDDYAKDAVRLADALLAELANASPSRIQGG